MKIQKYVMEMGVILLAVTFGLAILVAAQVQMAPAPKKGEKTRAGDYRISKPYTHENLTVFLIYGKDKVNGKTFLTLQDAMEQKKVIVHETSEVNRLAIENVSQDEEIYIQSGEIVKGGKQDRVLAYDLILPRQSGKIPIASFCVEPGRWTQRGREGAAEFGSSSEQLATKDLKIAAKQMNSQGEVWKRVGEAQEKLSRNLGQSVRSEASASSLQLTLENRRVQEAAQDYIKDLSQIVERKKSPIGYVFAINGRVNSADIYASSALFKKLWPKLLRASAIEAIAELQKEKKFEPATAESVKTFLLDAEKGSPSEKPVTERIKLVKQETEKNILFETRDQQQGMWIHKNYLAK